MNVNQLISAIDGISDRHILACADIKSVTFTEDDEDDGTPKAKNDCEQGTDETTPESSGVRYISKKRKTVKSLMLVAVITVLIAALTIAVASSETLLMNISNGIFELTGKRLTVIDDKLDKTPEKITPKSGMTVDGLTQAGITDIVLPTALLGDEWEQLPYSVKTTSGIIYTDFFGGMVNRKNRFIVVNMYVNSFDAENSATSDSTYFVSNIKKSDILSVNGLDVVIIQSKDGYFVIKYIVDSRAEEGILRRTKYNFRIENENEGDITFDEVVEIAKTLA